MANAPMFKVYDRDGNYQAACKEPEAAGALMGFYGEGATIRYGHRKVLWTEGVDGGPGSENAASFDEIAETCYARMGGVT